MQNSQVEVKGKNKPVKAAGQPQKRLAGKPAHRAARPPRQRGASAVPAPPGGGGGEQGRAKRFWPVPDIEDAVRDVIGLLWLVTQGCAGHLENVWHNCGERACGILTVGHTVAETLERDCRALFDEITAREAGRPGGPAAVKFAQSISAAEASLALLAEVFANHVMMEWWGLGKEAAAALRGMAERALEKLHDQGALALANLPPPPATAAPVSAKEDLVCARIKLLGQIATALGKDHPLYEEIRLHWPDAGKAGAEA